MRPRLRALRNALAVHDASVGTVRVRTDERAAGNVVGHDADARRFAFEGSVYEARVDRTSD